MPETYFQGSISNENAPHQHISLGFATDHNRTRPTQKEIKKELYIKVLQFDCINTNIA